MGKLKGPEETSLEVSRLATITKRPGRDQLHPYGCNMLIGLIPQKKQAYLDSEKPLKRTSGKLAKAKAKLRFWMLLISKRPKGATSFHTQ